MGQWAYELGSQGEMNLGPEDRVEQLSPSDCTNELDS